MQTVQACASWLAEFREWNGIAIIEPTSPTHVLTTDASQMGYGMTVRALDGSMEMHTQWILPPNQAHRTSNWRELSAISFAIKRCSAALAGATLKVRSESTTSLACIRRQGSRFAELTEIGKLLRTAAHFRTQLMTEFIPGRLNVEADRLSRWFVRDPYGYQLHPLVLATLQERWGPLENN